jgi:hypothetical protein
MDLLIDAEYLFLGGCLEKKPKYDISESFALIIAFRIIWIHTNRLAGDGERAVAASGSNQPARILEHPNYANYLVSRVPHESPTSPLSNAPTLNKIRSEMNEK